MNKKLIMIIAGVVVALLVAGGGAYFMLKGGGGGGGGGGHGKSSSSGGHGGGGGSSEAEVHNLYKLDPFIVNLQDNSGTRYLKVTINLELEGDGTKEEIDKFMPKIRDSLIILLSSKGYNEIGTVEGKYKLREEIVERINSILKEGKVLTAYFTEFVIQ